MATHAESFIAQQNVANTQDDNAHDGFHGTGCEERAARVTSRRLGECCGDPGQAALTLTTGCFS
jgi:hypothetical protein